MPPRLPKTHIGSKLLVPSSSPFVCPSCLYRSKHLTLPSRQKSQWHPTTRRVPLAKTASTVASVTAIDAPKEVPHTFRELHKALAVLQDKAANYVNLSQLQLALRGLESTDAVIRVAGASLSSVVHLRIRAEFKRSPGSQWPARRAQACKSSPSRSISTRGGVGTTAEWPKRR